MTDDYENPTPGQRAHADQQIAATQTRLIRLLNRTRFGDLEAGHDRTIGIGLAVVDELDTVEDDDQLPAAIALVGAAVGLLADLLTEIGRRP